MLAIRFAVNTLNGHRLPSGNVVGPAGSAETLSKEALEAAAEPVTFPEWAGYAIPDVGCPASCRYHLTNVDYLRDDRKASVEQTARMAGTKDGSQGCIKEQLRKKLTAVMFVLALAGVGVDMYFNGNFE